MYIYREREIEREDHFQVVEHGDGAAVNIGKMRHHEEYQVHSKPKLLDQEHFSSKGHPLHVNYLVFFCHVNGLFLFFLDSEVRNFMSITLVTTGCLIISLWAVMMMCARGDNQGSGWSPGSP
jgi:hypothetical protein